MARWRWIWLQVSSRLWLRATLIGALGVLAAILAAVAENYIPWSLSTPIGADAIDSLLSIIASSMLAVTTFSLSVMTSAYGSATSNVTPRATKLVMEDSATQNVLSTFIGSFLFSIVGIVALKAGVYGDRGRVVLFIVTIAVIALIVISLLHWIDHLTKLGRVGETTRRVEVAAEKAIRARLRMPYLGGVALSEDEPSTAESIPPVTTQTIGYVQFVDVAALNTCCEEHNISLQLQAVPGTFVYSHTPLARIVESGIPREETSSAHPGDDGETPEEREEKQQKRLEALHEAIRDAFSISDERSFPQDPRFGLAVMSEIASRALSPGINDPGTAIDIIGRSTRLMNLWAQGEASAKEKEAPYPLVQVPPLRSADLFDDAFMAIARDGAGLIEVQLRLHKALIALSHTGDETFRAAAWQQARQALARAEQGLSAAADKTRLQALAEQSGMGPPPSQDTDATALA
ncbi:DUF2254 domain-containing protein [Xanthobacter sp. TB0139]|uniref:DUF2254 domain-containing protein n=1 Tax=Xanthobacter sp. TB0139 TaxID=3459178 RepID=UPI004039DA68